MYNFPLDVSATNKEARRSLMSSSTDVPLKVYSETKTVNCLSSSPSSKVMFIQDARLQLKIIWPMQLRCRIGCPYWRTSHALQPALLLGFQDKEPANRDVQRKQHSEQAHEPSAVPRECSTEGRPRASSCTQRMQYWGQTHEPAAVPWRIGGTVCMAMHWATQANRCLQLQGNTGNLYCYHMKLCV